MTPVVAFIVFLIGALMAAVIAGMLAALLHSPAMGIVAAAAGTFVAVLGLAMTAYHFVKRT